MAIPVPQLNWIEFLRLPLRSPTRRFPPTVTRLPFEAWLLGNECHNGLSAVALFELLLKNKLQLKILLGKRLVQHRIVTEGSRSSDRFLCLASAKTHRAMQMHECSSALVRFGGYFLCHQIVWHEPIKTHSEQSGEESIDKYFTRFLIKASCRVNSKLCAKQVRQSACYIYFNFAAPILNHQRTVFHRSVFRNGTPPTEDNNEHEREPFLA